MTGGGRPAAPPPGGYAHRSMRMLVVRREQRVGICGCGVQAVLTDGKCIACNRCPDCDATGQRRVYGKPWLYEGTCGTCRGRGYLT